MVPRSLLSRRFSYKYRVFRAKLLIASRWLGYIILLLILSWGVYPQNFAYLKSLLLGYHAQHFDFRIQKIIIDHGKQSANLPKVKKLLAKYKNNKFNIINNDIASIIKEDLESLNWVDKAQVKLILPDTLKASIVYKVPNAILVRNKKLYLVDKEGSIIEHIKEKPSSELIYLVGQEANLNYSKILSKLEKNEIYSEIEALTYVSKSRWNIQLKNNVTIKLPKTDIELALRLLHDIKQKKYLQKNTSMIDLRLIPSRIYIK